MTIDLKIQYNEREPLVQLPYQDPTLLLLFTPLKGQGPHLLAEGVRNLTLSGSELEFQTDRAMIFKVSTQNLLYGSVPKIYIGSNGAVTWARTYFNTHCKHVHPSIILEQTLGTKKTFRANNVISSKIAYGYIASMVTKASSSRFPLLENR